MSVPKYHWLISAQVVIKTPDAQFEIPLNVMIMTDEKVFARQDIERSQRGALHRYSTEIEQIPGGEIVDCFILNISNLGRMTTERFNAGFEQKTEKPLS
jgi:hypothetical protein